MPCVYGQVTGTGQLVLGRASPVPHLICIRSLFSYSIRQDGELFKDLVWLEEKNVEARQPATMWSRLPVGNKLKREIMQDST